MNGGVVLAYRSLMVRPNQSNRWRSADTVALLLSFVMGIVGWTGVTIATDNDEPRDHPWYFGGLVIAFLVAAALGYWRPARWWLWGTAAIAFQIPFFLVDAMSVRGVGANLWPLGLGFLIVLSGLGAGASQFGASIRKTRESRAEKLAR
jgi:hypothetical protein